MKFTPMIIGFLLFGWMACQQTPSKPTNPQTSGILIDDSPFVKDTAKINLIDDTTFAVNKSMFHKPKLHELDVTHLQWPNLKIGYYHDPESQITRILVSENEYRLLNIKYLFYKDSVPLLIHHRYWDRNPSPQVTNEIYMYFDEEGKMFYAGERSAEVYEGEKPEKLKAIELAIPKMSKKELYDFALKYWDLAMPLVEEHKREIAQNPN